MRLLRVVRWCAVAAAVSSSAAAGMPAALATPAAASPGALAATPDVLFPPTFVGGTAPNRTILVRNLGAAPVTLASTVSVPSAALKWTFSGCLGATLAPKATCPVSVRYQPADGLADFAKVRLPTADGTTSVVLIASGTATSRAAASR